MALGMTWSGWSDALNLPAGVLARIESDYGIPADRLADYRRGTNPDSGIVLYDMRLVTGQRVTVEVMMLGLTRAVDSHPELERLVGSWDDMADTHETWIALSRCLELVATNDHQPIGDLAIAEIERMIRAAVAFTYKALPLVDYAPAEFEGLENAARVRAFASLRLAVNTMREIANNAVGYDLDEMRELARREAYGL